MLSRHHSTAWLALTSTLLVTACDGGDSGTTQASTGTSTDTADETETGSDSDGACTFDESDATNDAQPQPLVLTNSSAMPLFVFPPGCVHPRVYVDTIEYRLGTRFACSIVANSPPPCYDSCDGNLLTPPIRVDPGASFDWPFAGYVWESASIPDSCQGCEFPEITSCGLGHLVDEGALVEFDVYVTSECALDQCECPAGETACLLDDSASGDEGPSGPTDPVSISFTHGSADPVIVDLAG